LYNLINIFGRASRKDFWIFQIIALIYILVYFRLKNEILGYFLILLLILGLIVIIRRLNDFKASRWWCLAVYIPLIIAGFLQDNGYGILVPILNLINIPNPWEVNERILPIIIGIFSWVSIAFYFIIGCAKTKQ